MSMHFLHEHIKVMSAHVKALYEIRTIKKADLVRVLSILRQLEKKRAKGNLKEKASNGYALITAHIAKKSKPLGKKILIGANKKDQTTTAKRLYLKDKAKEVLKETKRLANAFLYFAEDHRNFAISKKSSAAHWSLSFTESLHDDIQILRTAIQSLDKSTLGSLDGYGTDLLIPRELATKELKLKQTQINSLYCSLSLEKAERILTEALAQIMTSLHRFASDSIQFLSPPSKPFKLKKSLRDLTGLKKIKKGQAINIENTTEALDVARTYLKSIKPNIPAKPNQPFSTKVSLGATGNLDIHHYRRLMRKV